MQVNPLRHDGAGVLSTVSEGTDRNTSQFLITLDSAPQLDTGHHVVFGRLLSGEDVLRKLGEVAVDDQGHHPTRAPKESTVIRACGLYSLIRQEAEAAQAGSDDEEPMDEIEQVDALYRKVAAGRSAVMA